MAVAAQPQTSLYETIIENAEIEEALEKRDKAKNSLGALRKKFEEADAAAKEKLNTLDLGTDATIRIGRFLVTIKKVAGRSVAFETDPTERMTIKPMADED